MSTLQIKVHRLSKAFGRRWVWHELTFDAQSGDCVVICGPNGSGKTTLLQCLCGLMRPTSGKIAICIGNEEHSPVDALPLIGALFDNCEPYDELTVAENLHFFIQLRRTSLSLSPINSMNSDAYSASNCDSIADEVMGLLTKFQMDDYRWHYASALSSGVRRRLKLAIAYAGMPPILALDEPTAGMDTAGRELVTAVVKEHCSAGGIAFWATNDERERAYGSKLVELATTSKRHS
ncbi:MAG TPA: ABC transporter ATP-binding protein [Armatimonadetes bacterium]|nr:ABC transporter ATP-binding protein [Armatimonadota bacterium]